MFGVSYFPIEVDKGATFNLSMAWNDPSGNPINLTGHAAKFEVFQDPNYFTPVIKASTLSDGMANTSITLGGSIGSITIQLQTQAVALLRDGQATVYGLMVRAADGITYTRLFEGPVTIKPLGVVW